MPGQPAQQPTQPRRIVVTGTTGSGKTTLALAVASRLGLPHAEQDAWNHLPGWQEAPLEQFRAAVDTFTALLPRYVNRYLYALSGLQRDSVQRRIARNATGTNSYLYMKIGNLNVTPAKTRTVDAQPSRTVYRRLLQQAAVPELIDEHRTSQQGLVCIGIVDRIDGADAEDEELPWRHVVAALRRAPNGDGFDQCVARDEYLS